MNDPPKMMYRSTNVPEGLNEKKKYYGSIISEYAMKDIDEFVAEAFAEYMNSTKKCRGMSKRVIAIIRR